MSLALPAEDVECAAGRLVHPGDEVKQGALAGAARPHQRNELPAVYRKIDFQLYADLPVERSS